MKKFSLHKEEKLKSSQAIAALFESSMSTYSYPIKIIYAINDSSNKKVAFSVSKRKFKNAVDRNHIKRLMREAYRLNKSITNDDKSIESVGHDLLFIYIANQIENIDLITKSVIKNLNSIKSNGDKAY